MAKNLLIDTLRGDDKTGHLFTANGTFVAYKTGFPTLDFNLGSKVNVYEGNQIVDTYTSLGISSGSIVEVIGKTHVG